MTARALSALLHSQLILSRDAIDIAGSYSGSQHDTTLTRLIITGLEKDVPEGERLVAIRHLRLSV